MTNKSRLALITLAGFAIIAWLIIRARTESARYSCITGLKAIDGAKNTWAMGTQKTNAPTWADLTEGISPILGWHPQCSDGGVYTLGGIGANPTCSMP
jgi:hypothetical protein